VESKLLESIHFRYGDEGKSEAVHSSNLGIINVQVQSGLFSEVFLPTKTINETKIRGRDVPYPQGVEYSPLEFPLTLFFDEGYDSKKIREVARWLCKDYYAPLIFDSNPERIFYAQFVNESKLNHNGCNEGYVELTVRCNSPFTYSHFKHSDDFYIDNQKLIEVRNDGDLPIKPEITIYKKGKEPLSIRNLSNQDDPFEFVELEDEETVYVDNQEEFIKTDITDMDRFDSFNDEFLTLERGVNRLLVKGSCIIRFRYQFIFLQG